MTLITDTTVGRFSTNVNEVMDHVRKPVFVDNAIHHARVEVTMDGKNKVTIEKNNATTFKVTPERKYKIVEGESSLQVTHNLTPGHNYTGNPFYSDDKISDSNQPDLLFNADAISQRLAPSSNISSTTGRTLFLQNMKNRRISDVGFSGDKVHFASPIDVGLRTTDLALLMGKATNGEDISINIGPPLAATNASQNRRHHSTRYVARDFRNVNLGTALKFISRHDKRMTLFDKFGNLMYVPMKFADSEKVVNKNYRVGDVQEDPIDDMPNRILVEGASRALNDTAHAIINDAEKQAGAEGTMIEQTSAIKDITVNTKQGAKRLGRQILLANATQKGRVTSNGHPRLTNVRPGDTLYYDGVTKTVMEVRHNLPEATSDLVLMNIDTGLEGVISDVMEGMVIEDTTTAPDTIVQKQTIDLSFFGQIKLLCTLNIQVREVGTSGMLLGGTKGTKTRGKIGGNGLGLGAVKRGVTNINKQIIPEEL